MRMTLGKTTRTNAEDMPHRPIAYRPQSGYWRRALMRESCPEKLRAYALTLVDELAMHKAAFRASGLMPPKSAWAPGEQADKAGKAVCNFR